MGLIMPAIFRFRYEGQWQAVIYSGRASPLPTLLICRYEGQWQAAVYAGYGSETFSKGSTYHGQYSAGLRNGSGACRFFNGDYYEGTWANGLRDGRGMQQVRGQQGRRASGGASVVRQTALYRKWSGGEGCGQLGLGVGSFTATSSPVTLPALSHLTSPPPPPSMQCTDDSNYVGDYSKGKRHGHGIYRSVLPSGCVLQFGHVLLPWDSRHAATLGLRVPVAHYPCCPMPVSPISPSEPP